MAIAIYLKTESSDDYVYCIEGTPSIDEIITYLKHMLGDEFNYISEMLHDATYATNFEWSDIEKAMIENE